jgi:hypothetical protein
MAPVVSTALSDYLRRPVQVGKLTPNLTVDRVYDMVLHPETYGSLPVQASDITIGNRQGEVGFAGSETLATVQTVTLYVALPDALAGKIDTMLPRVLVTSPTVTVVRYRNGQFNLADIIPPQKPPTKPQPPFRTRVVVSDARVTFRDFDKNLPKNIGPALNAVFCPKVNVDLSGSRTVAFSVTDVRALPGSPTVSRLGGTVTISGTMRRADPGTSPYAPPPGIPFLTLQIHAGNADIAYWLPYIYTPPEIAIAQGRGDADVALILPDRSFKSPVITVNARFWQADASLKTLAKVPFKNSSGSLQFADGGVRFDAHSQILGEMVDAQGAVWNLPEIGGVQKKNTGHPAFHVAVNVPSIPVQRALIAFLPNGQRLPPQLTVGGNAATQVTVSGVTSGNLADLTVIGHIRGVDGSWRGVPGVQNVISDVVFSHGVLQLSHTSATLVGGGSLTGEGTVRLLDRDPTRVGNAVFSAQANGVDLEHLSLLAGINRGDRRTRLRGTGAAQAVGQRLNGRLTAAVNITTQNLFVGRIPVPVARARVLVQDNQYAVSLAQVESPAGIASVSGDVLPAGKLNLRFSTASLDLKTLGNALGFTQIAGTISSTGTVSGTVKQPLVHLVDLVGMNLRLRIPAPNKKTGPRELALDLLRAQNVELSHQRLRLNRPLMVYRFPAAITVSGEVKDLTPTTPKGKFNPRFNLLADVRHLSYEEIQRQFALEPPTALKKKTTKVVPPPADAPNAIAEDANEPDISGSIATATVRLQGTLTDPDVSGKANLGTIVIGSYPFTKGNIVFLYNKRQTEIRSAEVTTSLGSLQASAVLTANGQLSGTFTAPKLVLEELSYLTKGLARFEGTASLAGKLSGTLERPVVTADIAAPALTVAGTTYQDLKADNISFTGGEKGRGGVIQVPSFSFRRQIGAEPSTNDTQVTIQQAQYDLTTGEVGAKMGIKNANASTLIETIRRSNLDDTASGAQVVRALTSLPIPPIDPNTKAPYPLMLFDIPESAVRGRIVGGKFENPEVDADLEAREIHYGDFYAKQLVLKGTLRNKVIDISQLEITQSGATIRGEGRYDPDGTVDAYIESNDASLGLVNNLPGLASFPVRGSVDFTISAKGPSKNPTVTASLQGRDLFFVTGSGLGQTRKNGDVMESGLPVSLLRLEADLTQSNPNQYNIVISDLLLKANDDIVLSADAVIPVNLPGEHDSVALRPLRFNIRTGNERDANNKPINKPIDLAKLADYLQGKATPVAAVTAQGKKAKSKTSEKPEDMPISDVGGNLIANISYGGSLETPTLSGLVAIENGHLRLTSNGGSGHISAIKSFDAALRLDGGNIIFDQFLIKLGGINGQKGDFGSVNVSGQVQIKTLADLEKSLRGQSTAASTDESNAQRTGNYDLAVNFDGLRPVVDNFFGLNEGLKGKVDGTLRVVGGLKYPTIETTKDAPLRITQAEMRLPSAPKETKTSLKPPLFNPKFAIAMVLPDTSTLTTSFTQLIQFRFDIKASKPVSITGHLFPRGGNGTTVATNDADYNLKVDAEFAPQGGRLLLPSSRFTVQRQGTVTVALGGNNPRIEAKDIRATSTISVRRGVSLTSTGNRDALSNPDILTSNSDATTAVSRYDVTMTLNAQLSLLDEADSGRSDSAASKFDMQFTSDPTLPSGTISALVLGTTVADQLQQGVGVDTAVKNFTQQTITNSYLPDFTDQFTGKVGQTLGLEDLSFNYGLDGSYGFDTKKRLSRPFDRFILGYSRTFQQRTDTGQVAPYVFSVNYELYEFKTTRNILPRLQLRFQTDDQHNNTYLLNGTITY